MSVGILILAAGRSRRMGTDKRLLPWRETRLLERSIQLCRDSGLSYRIALSCREEDDLIAQRCEPNCIRIKESDLGLGHTLAQAIGSLPRSWSGVIVHLADMPLVQVSTFQTIAHELQKHPIVIPSYQQQWGNPRGFSQSLWPELALLRGDQGAKDLIKKHSELCCVLDLTDAGVLVDIDTQKDYQTWQH